jgi:mono/diheme cytochrome c family protein
MRILILLLASAGVLGTLLAQNNIVVKKVPLQPTSAASGEQMFGAYCAPCHGKDGKGNGPAAPAMKNAPTDLTSLATHNKGKFPNDRVFLAITSPRDFTAHGSGEMPVWGEVLRSLDRGDPEMAHLRVSNLTSYIKSIQVK